MCTKLICIVKSLPTATFINTKEIPKNTKGNRFLICFGHYFLSNAVINLNGCRQTFHYTNQIGALNAHFPHPTIIIRVTTNNMVNKKCSSESVHNFKYSSKFRHLWEVNGPSKCCILLTHYGIFVPLILKISSLLLMIHPWLAFGTLPCGPCSRLTWQIKCSV